MVQPSLSRTAFLCAVLVLCILPTASAVAIPPPQVFPFYGVCTDCDGTVYAELRLYHTYVIGKPILDEHFISFFYGGSNLLDSFTIYQDDLESISGEMTGVPGTEEFHIRSKFGGYDGFGPMQPLQEGGEGYYFDSCSAGSTHPACYGGPDGYWETGILRPRDFGESHSWSGASGEIPEPGTFVLLSAGLAAMGLARRLRR